eukprot:gb/GEZN01028685.1/.p1 GENE.gb/GEZN01028685.1/~~gb/GEZN01028685.1/.p1  ORF type:complete len:111 (-),score=7.22 gb/GEZN01028685.1/:80-412(-)
MDLLCCGQCCGSLSALGFVFLGVVGMLLKSENRAIPVKGISSEDAASTCIQAAGIYGGFLFMSLLCAMKAKFSDKYRVELDDPRISKREGRLREYRDSGVDRSLRQPLLN